jgi:outer membrane protein insertion porin family
MWRRVRVGLLVASSIVAMAVSVAGAFPLTVTDIQLDGLVYVKESKVRDVIPFDVGDEVVESDLKAASQAIHDLGWFGEVLPEVVGTSEIVFHVKEYPRIEEIEISGNVNRSPISLFGIEIMHPRIMPTTKVLQLLRRHGIKKKQVINRAELELALKDILAEYNDRGYVLVGVGDVKMESTLSITLLEGRVSGNRIEGLVTVPLSVPEEMIDLPLGEPLRQTDIQKVLLALGSSVFFSDTEVVPEVTDAEDEVTLVWNLTERSLIDEPLEIARIELDGVTQIPLDEAQSVLGEIPEGPIDNYGLLQIVKGLFDRYQDDGYMLVRFSADAESDGVLRLHVEEGVVSEILLSGNTRTQSHVVLRNLKIEVGDLLTRRTFQRAYQRINSFGYFSSLELLPEWTDDGVRLAVIVTETTDLGGMNGSVAIEPGTGGIVGELTINQKNLMGTGQDVSITYSRGLGGGTEPMTSTWTLGYDTVAAFEGFDNVGVDLYRSMREVEEDDVTQEYMTVGGEVSFAYPIGDYTDASLSYKHEDERLAGTSDWTPIDTIGFGVAFDNVNDPAFPTGGNRQSVGVEKAGGFASGEEYTKLNLRWIEFAPANFVLFGDLDQAFAVRLMAGWAGDDLPATQCFIFGGAMTVRGTDVQRVPRMFLGNFEYRVELAQGLVLAAFFDAGVNLDAVSVAESLASTGFEFGINAAGIIVRLEFIWAFDEEMSWFPVFDVGFGAMF